MSCDERPIVLPLRQDRLIAILHRTRGQPSRGVLIVVGGPQYRVGSHRQFVLLARALAAAGFPVLRFDYRGMGDSSGDERSFLNIDDDIRAAADILFAEVPSLRELVVWGLCDAASATLFYAPNDERVVGVILLNPWVRTESGYARTLLRHYYVRRFLSRSFWTKLVSGRLSTAAFGDLADNFVKTLSKGEAGQTASGSATPDNRVTDNSRSEAAFPKRMLISWRSFKGRVLLVLSGNDLTAAEFCDLTKASRAWRKTLKRPSVTRLELPAANHTFSTREWRDQVALWTIEWLRSW